MIRAHVVIAVGVLGVLAVPGRARAAPIDEDLGLAAGHDILDTPRDDGGPIPDYKLRWELGVDFELGGMQLGTQGLTAGGVRVESGLRYDRLELLGAYSLLGLGDGACTTGMMCRALVPAPPGDGLEQRLGIDARVSVWRGKLQSRPRHAHYTTLVRTDLYVEGGVGVERLDWGAMKLWRDDVGFGFGMSVGGGTDTQHGAVRLGLRGSLARDPIDPMGAVDPTVMITIGGTFGD